MEVNTKILYEKKIKNDLTFTSSKSSISQFLEHTLCLISPGMVKKNYENEHVFLEDFKTHLIDLKLILSRLLVKEKVDEVLLLYVNSLEAISSCIERDARFMLEGDPAARSLSEVIACYPGFLAISVYRLAHFFFNLNIPLLPRILSEIAHEKTGIDIHPGAQIGESFFIDHGTGIVIGESSIIGNFVKIYQGVTLGALSVSKALAQTKRHPTIEDHCIIYSHATILGGETVIGAHSTIGGNVWITKSVAPNSLVYHKSEVKLDIKKDANSLFNQEELSYEI